MANLQSIWTYSLVNDVITITSDFNFTRISFLLISGTGTYKGGLTSNAIPSAPCTLQVGQSVEIDLSTSAILNTIILDTTTGGEIQIIGRG
jgi:hypothetical protein